MTFLMWWRRIGGRAIWQAFAGSWTEPAISAKGGEAAFVLGPFERRRGEKCGGCRPRQEVRVNCADGVLAHLDVAGHFSWVRRRRRAADDTGDEYVGDRGSLAQQPAERRVAHRRQDRP